MDPSTYDRDDLEQALERRGLKKEVDFELFEKKDKLFDLLRHTVRAQEAEKKKLDTLPRSALRRLPLPYELIKLIRSFVVGPRAIATHFALSQLNSSVRSYLFGETKEKIEERWKTVCLRSGIGQHRSDLQKATTKRSDWEEMATRLVENRWGLGASDLLVSWSRMESSSMWTTWNSHLFAMSSFKVRVFDEIEIEKKKIQLLVNPAVLGLRLINFNDLELDFKTLDGNWYSSFDWPDPTALLLTWPAVSSLNIMITDVSGEDHLLYLSNPEGVVIWDLYTAWQLDFSALIGVDTLREYVEGQEGDFSESIPTNEDEELYELAAEDDMGYVFSAHEMNEVLQEIIKSHGGKKGLTLGRVLFGEKVWFGKTVAPKRGATEVEIILEDHI